MDIPIRFLPTQTLAPETFLVRQIGGEGMGPEALMLNSMVIRGAEPVIVDTGVAVTRPEWLEQTFSLVDPADVRWVYLSHDDTDHTGNLNEVMALCPNATLVTNWFTVERMLGDLEVTPDRMRILNPGDSLVTPDRVLTALVPPVFDSPTTRGLHDSATGVYWGSDAFACGVPTPVDDIGELPVGHFRESFLHLQRLISPWHQWLDPAKYARLLDGVRSLRPTVAVGCHGPALRGHQVESAFLLLEELPHLPACDLKGQVELDALIEVLGAMPAPGEEPATATAA